MKAANQPLVSVVMPTLNSERTIRLSLESIRGQNYDQEKIEIILADGGSTDKTLELGKEFNCRVVPNPRVQPECGKHEGIVHSKGEYAIFLDSDEVFNDSNAITRRVSFLEDNPKAKIVLTGGYQKPAGANVVNDYINTFSDPFSFFMYGISSEYPYYVPALTKACNGKHVPGGVVLHFEKHQTIPLADISAGNMINLSYVRETFKDRLGDVNIVPEMFTLLVSATHTAGILEHDFIYHHCADTLKKYVRKLAWRVIINTHFVDTVGVGFANREAYQPLMFRLKKYLFVPYALSFVLPLLRSLPILVQRKSWILLLHAPLSWYVAAQIVIQQIRKVIKAPPKLKAYGK